MTFVGIFLSANKKKRMKVYSELYEFNEKLILNMKFSRAPVSKIAEEFDYVSDLLEGKKVLSGDDEQFLSAYVSSLGKSDAISQVDYLNDRKAALAKLRDESRQNYTKYSSLYVRIFFMLGVLMAVLLV